MAQVKGSDTTQVITERTTTSLYRELRTLSGLFHKTHKLKYDWAQSALY